MEPSSPPATLKKEVTLSPDARPTKKKEVTLVEEERKPESINPPSPATEKKNQGQGHVYDEEKDGAVIGFLAALYDYNATANQEISFKAGDILALLAEGNDGWWKVELNGRAGNAPSTFFEKVEEKEKEKPKEGEEDNHDDKENTKEKRKKRSDELSTLKKKVEAESKARKELAQDIKALKLEKDRLQSDLLSIAHVSDKEVLIYDLMKLTLGIEQEVDITSDVQSFIKTLSEQLSSFQAILTRESKVILSLEPFRIKIDKLAEELKRRLKDDDATLKSIQRVRQDVHKQLMALRIVLEHHQTT